MRAALARPSRLQWASGKFLRWSGFGWQDGSGAFSIGHSQITTTIRYIQNQRVRHRKQRFEDEYRNALHPRPIPGLLNRPAAPPCGVNLIVPMTPCQQTPVPPPSHPNPAEPSATSATSGDRLRELDTYVPVVMPYEELWEMIERNMGHPLIPVTDWSNR